MSEALEVFMTAIIYRKNAGLSNGHSHTYLSPTSFDIAEQKKTNKHERPEPTIIKANTNSF